MVAKKAAEVDAFLRRADGAFAVSLVYGPNAGLVSERARLIATQFVANGDDPFQLVRINGDELAADPLRLANEAHTIGLFGARRSIWISLGARSVGPALEPILKLPPTDTMIVVEAGELAKNHPLRLMVEASRHAVALPCYADESRDSLAIAESMLRENGIALHRDARDRLTTLLGADRLLNRREIEKLALYAQGESVLTVEMVEAVTADAAAALLDQVIDRTFSGEPTAQEAELSRIFADGTDPGTIVGQALRHALMLHRSRLAIDTGTRIGDLTRRIHFKRKAIYELQLRRWTPTALESAMTTLRETQAQVRRNASMGRTLVRRALLAIATRAARAGRPED